MLELIESKLQEVLNPVYYGTARDDENITLWNYLVFWRDNTKRSANNTSYTDYYTVAIVHENWVPDALIEQVITNMESIAGMRLSSSEIGFDYSRKPSTDATIEIARMTFSVPRKRV